MTRRAWLTLLAAGACAVAGRVFGILEFFVLAGVLTVLVATSAAWSRWRRLDLTVSRRIHPPRVHAGTPCSVELQVTNRRRRGTPVLELDDAVSGTPGAHLLIEPIVPGHSVTASYRLPTDRRGILQVGPLRIALDDPFGLTDAALDAAGITEITVYPRIDRVAPVPQTTGNDPMAGAEHPNALGRSGEDFYALRPYTVGDDLRRVHWASTARHDELMVRQDELPWQGRATVLVDTRAGANTADSLELVISAAASIVAASAGRDDLIRLLSTDGYDSGFAAGHAHTASIMEHLAAVEEGHGGVFDLVVDRMVRAATGGALVVVSAGLSPTELERLRNLRRRFGSVLVVWFEASSWGADPNGATGGTAPPGCLPVTERVDFATAWNTRLAGRSLSAGWKRTKDRRGAWSPPEPERHEFDPFAMHAMRSPR